MRHIPQLLLIFASLAFAYARIENAVAIHTAVRDYVEFDIAPLLGCELPVVDSVYRQGNGRVVVEWRMTTTSDSLCPNAIRANILRALPVTVDDSKTMDTVVDVLEPNPTTFTGVMSITFSTSIYHPGVPQVRNPALPTACPMVKCMIPDSATALLAVQRRLLASSFVAVLGPYISRNQTFVAVSPWNMATGLDDFPDVVAPLPGNKWNWIFAESRSLSADSLISLGGASSCLAPVVCPPSVLVIPPFGPRVVLLTGPVGYIYQDPGGEPFGYPIEPSDSASTPDSILDGPSADAHWFAWDSLIKIGPRLHLFGYVKHVCGQPMVDSELIQESRWLVASTDPSADSLMAAFRLPGYCNFARPGAWPLRDGRVEIMSGIWVPLQDLLATTGVRTRKDGSSNISLRRVGNSALLDLPATATVRVVDLAGREVVHATVFSAGSHALVVPSSRSILFVTVRMGSSTTTLPLQPLR